MASLSRTSTNTTDFDLDRHAENNNLTTITFNSVSSSPGRDTPAPLKAIGRSFSHSLLAAANNADLSNRKGGHLQSAYTKTTMDTPNISMPPPPTKPLSERHVPISARPSEDSSPPTTSPPSSIRGSEDGLRLPMTGPTSGSTTAINAESVTTSSSPQLPGLPVTSPPSLTPNGPPNFLDIVSRKSPQAVNNPPSSIAQGLQRNDNGGSDGPFPQRSLRSVAARSSSRDPRRFSGSTANSTASEAENKPRIVGTIGVCALDAKARSRPSRSILTRLQGNGEFEVVVFGDKAILDEAVENWPVCDFLISFYSDGFPLDKAIDYVKLRKPFVVNDLCMQKILWDRRLCLRILDQMGVPTPPRVEVDRDGGPRIESAELAFKVRTLSGVFLDGPKNGTGGGSKTTKNVALTEDGDTLVVDGKSIKKPFVEKPVSGEDHNVMIYFPRNYEGGGGRRLFRKIGNKSSEYDPNLITPRSISDPGSSYIYEQFLQVENHEDIKAYTVGPDYCHAETRKSPVVDGVVRRNNQGKELRYVTKLTKAEALMAAKITKGFGQRICGFDLLRTDSNSYVIDVNGWSFVKDNNDYYDQCAHILRDTFIKEKLKRDGTPDRSSEEPIRDVLPNITPSYRSALKTILKSPSMSRISNHIQHPSRNHHHHHHHHGAASSEPSAMTTPITSPPSVERRIPLSLPPPIALTDDVILPPAVVNGDDATTGEEPPVPAQKEKAVPLPSSKHSWKLKGIVSVIRHADRTPKQKYKFTFHSQPFVELLKGHQEEVLLKGEAALASVEAAVKVAIQNKLEDLDKLKTLRNALAKKGGQVGTKVQIKPMFRKRKSMDASHGEASDRKFSVPGEAPIPEHTEAKVTDQGQVLESPTSERRPSSSAPAAGTQTRHDSMSGATFSRFAAVENDLILDKLQLVIKWGGEPTHAARYQCQDLGINMRDDLKLLNREALNDVRIFTSSENRVRTSAQIWAADFLGRKGLPDDFIAVRKNLLDDSNAAKDVMDKVKKKLKVLLREGHRPEHFAWPKNTPEPTIVLQTVVDLMNFHRRVLRHNFKKLEGNAAASLAAIHSNEDGKDGSQSGKEPLTSSSIQARWCTGEDAQLFRERWEKLFTEFCDSEKVDPSKISELYDSMKFDAFHNRQFLEWVFTPSQSLLDEIAKEEQGISQETETTEPEPTVGVLRHESVPATNSVSGVLQKETFAQKIGLRRRSVLARLPSPLPVVDPDSDPSYFKLYRGSGDTKVKSDQRLSRLKDLYRYSKILFDYVGPQEYGISDSEKLEIGLLTSLPLLREVVQDLEELQASDDAKSFIYFTKESHIYTLLNCILEGGIKTKISRATIPELDYLSQIKFELYEAKDDDTGEYTYSIVIKISPGCYTLDPLDVSLDSKHAIKSAPLRSLTYHQDWKEVIETLKAKFETVQLPKSFLAVNVSDKIAGESDNRQVKEEETEDD